jgi:plastocyanin
MCPGTIVSLMILLQSAANPSTGSVSGKIEAAGQLPEMIVYLEAVDPNLRFAPPRQPAVISQKGAKFAPSLLVVTVGQQVDFHNDEDRPIEHNVFSRSLAKQFDLGLYPPPQSKSVVFDKPGQVKLLCSIHRYMDGMIYVCPTPFFAKVAPDGTYRIENVTPGDYRLKTWQRPARYNEQDLPIRLESGKETTLNLEMKRE